MREWEVQLLYEDFIEDYVLWLWETRPSGRQVSGASGRKYVSSVRAWYHRLRRVQLGLGAAGSRIADLARGYGRLVPQPPPLERWGISPERLVAAWAAVRAPVQAPTSRTHACR